MMPDLDLIEWAAWLSGAVTVLLLAGGFVLGPAGERLGARRFTREVLVPNADDEARWVEYKRTGVLPAAAVPAPRRWGVGEVLTRAAHWVAAKVLRLDRTGGDR